MPSSRSQGHRTLKCQDFAADLKNCLRKFNYFSLLPHKPVNGISQVFRQPLQLDGYCGGAPPQVLPSTRPKVLPSTPSSPRKRNNKRKLFQRKICLFSSFWRTLIGPWAALIGRPNRGLAT